MVKSKTTKILSATDRKQRVGRAVALSVGKADRAARQRGIRGRAKDASFNSATGRKSSGKSAGSGGSFGDGQRTALPDSIEPFKSTSGVDVRSEEHTSELQ